MPARFQRLILIAVSLALVISSLILVLFNVKSNIVFFLTPSEMIEQNIKNKDKIRIGGIVKNESLKFHENTNLVSFIITDNENEIYVNYNGITPDLFKEGSGVVAEGAFSDNLLAAKKIFAKHDENYMPPDIAKQLMERDSWKKDYK